VYPKASVSLPTPQHLRNSLHLHPFLPRKERDQASDPSFKPPTEKPRFVENPEDPEILKKKIHPTKQIHQKLVNLKNGRRKKTCFSPKGDETNIHPH